MGPATKQLNNTPRRWHCYRQKGFKMTTTITATEIRKNLDARLAEERAELEALKAVKINVRHNVLTNRAIDGATVFNYLDINKAIRVSYTVQTPEGGRRYCSREITAYTYNNPDGSEIGTNGIMRISRTYTPAELAEVLRDIIESKAEFIGTLESEHNRAEEIAEQHNVLAEQINKFNDGVSYASKAQI